MKTAKFASLACILVMPFIGQAQESNTATAGVANSSATTTVQAQQEKCTSPKGTIAVQEPQDDLISRLRGVGLESPNSVIRMIIQQSNCFQVIDRGLAMQNMMQERQLADSGMLQQGSNVGKGQMVSADFVLSPKVVFADNNAGGVGGGLLGVFGNAGKLLGAVVGGLKFKQAKTSLLLIDARSGIQIAAVEGNAEKTDFSLGGGLGGGGGGGGLGGYTNTNEGKMIAASFLDNWNKLVREVRENPTLIQAKAGAAAQNNAASSVQAGAAAEGDVMVPKIANVKLLKTPKDGAPELTQLAKGDEVLYLGEEKDGYLKVQASKGEGWVKKVLLKKI